MNAKQFVIVAMLLLLAVVTVNAQRPFISDVWVPDLGDGRYKNPIIHADYSDPDAIRVGDDFYLVASSFNAVPGIPILHSTDLINWRIINHVFTAQPPKDVFDKPQNGGGVWAPAIRYHSGLYYIYYPDPDIGIYVTMATNPAAEWSTPLLVKAAKGWIDPCPFWDDDGSGYLVHAFAGSRAGIKSVLAINRMNRAGTALLDDGVIVYDGHDANPTVEGPKLYKRAGYYYIFAPAGGVATGWQLALRARNIYGPYEVRTVLEQGKSNVNGPHQGAWVTTALGESWFLHFQDMGPYGRVVHLEPMDWQSGFPVIGVDQDGDGIGEPVAVFRKPKIARPSALVTPQESDEFESAEIGPQWQWNANSQATWAFPFPQRSVLRMFSVFPLEKHQNLWHAPNLLLQKFPAPSFTATTKLTLAPRIEGEKFGLLVMGMDYSYLSLTFRRGKIGVGQSVCMNADRDGVEAETEQLETEKREVFLRLTVEDGAVCQFSFSLDGNQYTLIGKSFKAREGRWVGARVGMFFSRPTWTNDAGSADVDWFRITK